MQSAEIDSRACRSTLAAAALTGLQTFNRNLIDFPELTIVVAISLFDLTGRLFAMRSKSSVALIAVALAIYTPSSYAAPVSKEAFAVASNVRSLADYLDASSRLALARSTNRRLRAFARSEAAEQTAVANAVLAWSEMAAQNDPRPQRRVRTTMGFVTLPLRAVGSIANGVAEQVDGLEEGRSVAADNQRETSAPVRLREIVLPSAQKNLRRLADAKGPAFDELYRTTQRDALLQLSTLYAGYVEHGGDAALRALATRELPKVNQRLADLFP